MNRAYVKAGLVALFSITLGGVLFSLPFLLAESIRHDQAVSAIPEQFPVTVNPQNKTIVENVLVDALFENASSPLQAAVGNVSSVIKDLFALVAISIANAPWYQSIAAVDSRFVTITPGMRKEQVAGVFASTLGWNAAEKKQFMTAAGDSSLPLPEGSFSPGVYAVTADATPEVAQALVNERFDRDILSHYGTATAAVVPLNQALTIASLIEREAGGLDDMRLISGIIWNRLFINMNLQIDATLQYARANTAAAKSWWPAARPADRYLKSPYNTYRQPGLPPTPIANPSVAAMLAALNPKNTSCLFYFHDAQGQFHCSDTYAGHVALLKQYYGRGK
ncbi:MAG: endolytic transglycosylase MltG [Candidatus Pacebacteria bacterium]|nr:endolytic transglycosylase MltG [Candidatus Paceibacterota bacterium]